MRVRLLCGVLMVLVLTSPTVGQDEFPFGQELILEERPLPGSKQRPILNVSANGEAEIDLWCRAGTGRVAVSGSTVTISLGAFPERPCTPERMQGDEQLAADLAQVAAWRREGEDIVVLIGPRDLRFRRSAH
jgi:heat shock protein HslJ